MKNFENSQNTNIIDGIDNNTPKLNELVSGTFLTSPVQLHEAELFYRGYERVLSEDPYLSGQEISLAQAVVIPEDELEDEDTTEDETVTEETIDVEDLPTLPDSDETSNYRESSLPIAEQFTGASVSLVGRAFGINHEIPGLGEFNPPLKDFRIPEERVDLELSPAILFEEFDLLLAGITEISLDICDMTIIREFRFRGDLSDPILGTNGDDEIFGDTSGNLFDDQEGDDQFILGANGDDTIFGDAGRDIKDEAKGGHDILFGEKGEDTIFGDAGRDIKHEGVGGDDIISGGRGDDELYGDAGRDIKDNGKGGDDIIFGDGMEFSVEGDTLFIEQGVGGGEDTIYGDAGRDIKDNGMGGDDCIHGGRGDDTIYGDAGRDIKDEAMGGNDIITGGSGDDTVIGDAGDDIQDWGRGGHDILCGEKGDDTIIGDAGDDIKDFGKGGNDILHGDQGDDLVIGDAGDDIKDNAMGGDDTLRGDEGDDTVIGDAGDDLGIWGADPCAPGHGGGKGGKGGDKEREGDKEHHALDVVVMGGNDVMEGNTGEDWMSGDAGDDLGFFVSKNPYNYHKNKMPNKGDDEENGNGETDPYEYAKDSFTVMGGDDDMFGGKGEDEMMGDAGSDLGFFALQHGGRHGGKGGDEKEGGGKGGHGRPTGAEYTIKGGDDYMEGNEGSDFMSGDAGENLGYFGNGDCGCEDQGGKDKEDRREGDEKGGDEKNGKGMRPQGDVFHILGGNDEMHGGNGRDDMFGDAGENLGFFKSFDNGDEHKGGKEGKEGRERDGGDKGGHGPQPGNEYNIKGGDDVMTGGNGDDFMSGDAGGDLGYFGDGECCDEGHPPKGGKGGDKEVDKEGSDAPKNGPPKGMGPQGDVYHIAGGDDEMFGGNGHDEMFGDAGGNLGFFKDYGNEDEKSNGKHGNEKNGDGKEGGGNGRPQPGDEFHIKGGDDYMEGNNGSDVMSGDAGGDLGFFGDGECCDEGQPPKPAITSGNDVPKNGPPKGPGPQGDVYHIAGGNDEMFGGKGDDEMVGDAGGNLGFFKNYNKHDDHESEPEYRDEPFTENNNNDGGHGSNPGDKFFIKGGNDWMSGGSGHDWISGDAGGDLGYWGDGTCGCDDHETPAFSEKDGNGGKGPQGDVYHIFGGDDSMFGGEGDDDMLGDAGGSLGFFKGENHEQTIPNVRNNQENGPQHQSNDEFIIKGGDDYMEGGKGEDFMSGDAGEDLGFFGNGDCGCGEGQPLWGEAEAEKGEGPQGVVYKIAGGNDEMYGGKGDDSMVGDAGRNLGFFENAYVEEYEARENWERDHNDSLGHGYSGDEIRIRGGDDEMFGGEGHDWMSGDAGESLGYFASLEEDHFYKKYGPQEEMFFKKYGPTQGTDIKIRGGDDWMEGNDGHDELFGDAGEDLGYFGNGDCGCGEGEPLWQDDLVTRNGNGPRFEPKDHITIKGGNDDMFGGNGEDVMSGDAGNDLGFFQNVKEYGPEDYRSDGHSNSTRALVLTVAGGNDLMKGGNGWDEMAGDAGNDLGFFSAEGHQNVPEELVGGGNNNGGHHTTTGNSYLIKGGNDDMFGGKGDDVMSGDAGNDLGFFGNDVGCGCDESVHEVERPEIERPQNNNNNENGAHQGTSYVIHGGNDWMSGGKGEDFMAGDAGDDLGFFVKESAQDHHSNGYNGDYKANDLTIEIFGGNDRMEGNQGDDFMSGDAGDDLGFFDLMVNHYDDDYNNEPLDNFDEMYYKKYGSQGNEYKIKGGDDRMWGGDGHDAMAGDAGDDLGYFEQESQSFWRAQSEYSNNHYHNTNGDTFKIKGGDDRMWGENGDDWMSGDAGEDLGYFEANDEYVEYENEVMLGNYSGKHSCKEGYGPDTFNIKGGNDLIDGGEGDDELAGDAGRNLGYFAQGLGYYVMTLLTLDVEYDNENGDEWAEGNTYNIMGGDDEMFGGNGYDVMSGDAFNDLGYFGRDFSILNVWDGGSDAFYNGYYGHGDQFCIMGGNDWMAGGEDDDVMAGDAGRDLGFFANSDITFGVNGGPGENGEDHHGDLFVIKGGNDEMYGGWGDDIMSGDAGQDLGYFSDFLTLLPAWEANGNYSLYNYGGHGNKYIIRGGNDKMWGGKGKDTMAGDAGRDLGFFGFGGLYTVPFATDYENGYADIFVITGGNDRMWGGNGKDIMSGDAGRDLVGFFGFNEFNPDYDVDFGELPFKWDYFENAEYSFVKGGHDIMRGENGNDTMAGDAGRDIIGFAVGGDDTMFGGEGNDTMAGDAGRDIGIYADPNAEGAVFSANDWMSGGWGNDWMSGDAGRNMGSFSRGGNDHMEGNQGHDTMAGDSGNNMQGFAQGGNDRMWGGDGDDFISGDAGQDMKGYAEGGNDVIYGNQGHDDLFGDAGDDMFDRSSGGNDRIYGGEGDDFISGDACGGMFDRVIGGDDQLFGGWGEDLITGDAGWNMEDRTRGGDDTIHGDEGRDKIYGDAGEMMLGRAIGGNDKLFGDHGNDTIYGDAHVMKNWAQGGHDRLIGGQGNDKLIGDAHTMRNNSEAGDDLLVGGRGNDELWGDAVIFNGGSAGEDKFFFNLDSNIGWDQIFDFNIGGVDDALVFADMGATSIGDIDALVTSYSDNFAGGDVTINFGTIGSITIAGVGTGGTNSLTDFNDDIGNVVVA